MKRFLSIFAVLLVSILLHQLVHFILEPDYIRCDTGDKWDWINDLEERLRTK